MRVEGCVACRYFALDRGGGLADAVQLAAISESLSSEVHHHHAIECPSCGEWWFDEIFMRPDGPMVDRRDTVPCPCPEDGSVLYTPKMIMVPHECRCTKAQIDNVPHLPISFKSEKP